MSDKSSLSDDELRDRIVAVIAAHEPVTDYSGADGECIECDLNPRWPDAPILPPSDGWKRHAEHLAAAVIAELGLRQEWLTEASSRLGLRDVFAEPERPTATRTSSPWTPLDPQPRRLRDVFAEADSKPE